MSLVAYSDSDDSADDNKTKQNSNSNSNPTKHVSLKRKRSLDHEQPSDLPPLPDAFHDLYTSTARISKQDDPSLHAGRQRQIPHVEGQWPTHIYLEWHPSRSESNALTKILADTEKALPADLRLHTLIESELGGALPLHISVSRTLMLATHQRSTFTDALRLAISESGVKPFTVTSDGLRWVANHEKNRWFLVVHVKKPPGDELNQLLRASNRVARSCGQPALYAPQEAIAPPVAAPKTYRSASKRGGSKAVSSHLGMCVGTGSSNMHEDVSDHFHVSIGWTLEEPPVDLLGTIAATVGLQAKAKLELGIDTVKAKIGNGVVVIPLASSKTVKSNGIIGL